MSIGKPTMKMKTLFKETFQYKETTCTIIADSQRAVKTAITSIKYHRRTLEEYVQNHPEFLCSLQPIPVHDEPLVVRLMEDTAEKANVGPMAAVAGILADLAIRDMVVGGSEVAVVENGGEVSAMADRPIDVALSAGNSSLSRKLGFRLTDFPVGIATSSGLFSHALSFGKAEAVTVFSESAGLADAAATAVGNVIKGKDCHRTIERGVGKALSIHGVEGVFIIYKGMIGTAGKIPQIIKVNDALT